MYTKVVSVALASLALVNAQAPPPASLLTSTQSGVLPVAPTPFSGVETNEGAIIYDGPPVMGFTGPGGNATVQSNLPKATYQAVLPMTQFDNLTGTMIMGSITGATSSNGTGILFTVNFTGFPPEASYGPYAYHIHGLPVPADGNCSATLSHLDPTNRGELHACEVGAPQTCQAGDLAGKHGNITVQNFQAIYMDMYLSTDPSSPYFFGDKSIVIHTSNTTRLTCANFTMVSGSTGTTGSNGTGSTGSNMTATPTVVVPVPSATGAAVRVAGGVVAGLMAVFAAMLL